ncbi:hypothetical protein [Sphingomonas japonica]|uniref:Uncharacterized protein n=1 Tax=Sphingomonas japonica TaxID=511662 RepID=A0ABX0TZW9_9SPHN|nr:hypothetical protein [Sphingomonas japonica]NIJ23866.1 hypothetical protein [Sphingomonas japonica]
MTGSTTVIPLLPALGERIAAEDRLRGTLLLECSDAAERGDFAALAAAGRAYREADQSARAKVEMAARLFVDP